MLIVRETLLLDVHFKESAQSERLIGQINLIGSKVAHATFEGLRCGRVGCQLLLDLFGTGVLSHPIGNIARVAQPAGKVALQDVGVEILHFPAPDRFDKVLEVAGLGTEFFDHPSR